MDNYYEELGVSQSATKKEIEHAIDSIYRSEHNRKGSPRKEIQREAENRIDRIEAAADVLLDEAKRTKYDAELAAAPKQDESIDSETDTTDGDLVASGWRYLAGGSVTRALDAATKATKKDGGNAQAWELLGRVKWRMRNYDDAIYEFKRAIDIAPGEAGFHFTLGSLYQELDRHDDAIQEYQSAHEIDPSQVSYKASIGFVDYLADRTEQAITTLEACVSEAPDNEEFKLWLGLAYLDHTVDYSTLVPPGHMIDEAANWTTTAEQVKSREELIQKAMALGIDDDYFAKQLERRQKVLASAKKIVPRDRDIRVALGGAFVWSVFAAFAVPRFGEIVGSTLFVVLFIGYWIFSRVPQYLDNRLDELINEKGYKKEKPLWVKVAIFPFTLASRAVDYFEWKKAL